MALQGVILYLLVLFPAALLIEDSPNNHPDGPPMTCGRIGSEKLLRKKSSNSICCGDEQYSPDTHCCCLDGAFRTEARGCSLCCEQDKNQAPLACCGQQPFDPSSAVCCGLKILAHPLRCCGGGDYNTSTQLCCGTLGKEKILSKKHEENICCGDAQYNNGTHECLGDPPSVKERPVSPGTRSDRASIPRPADSSALPVSSVMAEQLAPSTVNLPVAEPGGRPRVRVSGRGPADPPDSRGTGPAPSSPSPRTTLRGMLFRSGRR